MPDEAPTTAAHELSTLRRDLHLSLGELAELAGLDEQELAEMESGARPIPHDLMAELMEELNAKGA